MSVNPGFGGQAFERVALDKLRALGSRPGPRPLLEIDGGIHEETIRDAAAAGAQLFSVGSAIFRSHDYKATISNLVHLRVKAPRHPSLGGTHRKVDLASNTQEDSEQAMLKIILVRPGACDFIDQARIQGTLDVPLNEHGKGEVAQLTKDLAGHEISAVYCSICQPAQDTAMAIAEALDVKLKTLRGMQNLNHGLWQGMLIDEVKRKQPTVYRQWQEQPESVRPPEGEMVGEAAERVDRVIDKLLKRHRQGAIALVVPEPLATLVKVRLGKGKVGDLWQAAAGHGDWQLLQVESESVTQGR